MELVIFSATAMISLLGGMLILSRSGARHGRAMAAGLLFLSGAEVCYLLFLFRSSLAVLAWATFFEMSCAGAFLVSVTSMEQRLTRNTRLIAWELRLLTAVCALYGALALFSPGAMLSRQDAGLVHLGPAVKAQAVFLLLIAVVIAIASVGSVVASLAPAEDRSIETIIDVMASSPFGGEKSVTTSDLGTVGVQWGIGLGAYLLVVAGVLMIAGGALHLASRKMEGEQKVQGGPA